MSAVDPWWEGATQIKTALETITDVGAIVAGHNYVDSWDEFLDAFTVTGADGTTRLRGWQIVEPTSGAAYSSQLQTLGGTVEIEDTLGFFIRGFTEMTDEPMTTQVQMRNLAWEVKRVLDRQVTFTFTDSGLSVPRSYPASGLHVKPMLFYNIECWGADMTKIVVLLRSESLS